MFCEKCGNRINDGDLFCANCGAKVKQFVKPPRKSNFKIWIFIPAIAAVMVVIIGGAIFVKANFFSDKSNGTVASDDRDDDRNHDGEESDDKNDEINSLTETESVSEETESQASTEASDDYTATEEDDNNLLTSINSLNDDDLYDQFFNNEIPSEFSESGSDVWYYADYVEFSDMYGDGTIAAINWADLDNDGRNEPYWDGYYGITAVDARNGHVYQLAMGSGTSYVCHYTYHNGDIWIYYCDTSHAGREEYYFEKYNGEGKLTDKFTLFAEYWDSPDDKYNEDSEFTYNDEAITMQQFESIRDEYLERAH